MSSEREFLKNLGEIYKKKGGLVVLGGKNKDAKICHKGDFVHCPLQHEN